MEPFGIYGFESMSNSQKIQMLAKQFLSDGRERSVAEIKDYITGIYPNQFTIGTWSGAIRSLVTGNPNIHCTRRGYYQYHADAGQPANKEERMLITAKEILQSAQARLGALVSGIDMTTASDELVQLGLKLRACRKAISQQEEILNLIGVAGQEPQ